MNFVVTGASSALGSKVIGELNGRGHKIKTLPRDGENSFSLDAGFSNPELYQDYHLLHFAYDYSDLKRNYSNINIKGIQKLLNQSQYFNSIIYMSSDSASLNSKSSYGFVKKESELLLLKAKNSIIIRIGLVGGMNPIEPYKVVLKIAKNLGILFFPKLNSKVYSLTNIDQIVDSIEFAIKHHCFGGPFSISDKKSLTIIEALELDGVKLKKAFNLPINLTYICVKVINVVLPIAKIRADSILSVMNQKEQTKSIWDMRCEL